MKPSTLKFLEKIIRLVKGLIGALEEWIADYSQEIKSGSGITFNLTAKEFEEWEKLKERYGAPLGIAQCVREAVKEALYRQKINK